MLQLGGYDTEAEAALAYDLAALKLRGPDTQLNFGIDNYSRECKTYARVTDAQVLDNIKFNSPSNFRRNARSR